MRLASFLPRRGGQQRASDHLGVICSPGRLSAAVVRSEGAQKPSLVAHVSLEADPTLVSLGRWLKQHRLQHLPANLMLPGEDYHILPFELPDVPEEEMAQASRWRIKDLIDFPVEEASLDCLRVPAPNGSGLSRNAWAVVAQRERVRLWLERAQAAGLKVQSIDIPELALRNLLSLSESGNAVGLLRIGATRASLIVAWRGELCTFRRFDLSVMLFESADLMARQTLFERLGLEVQRTADAFERQFYGGSIERIWVEQSVPDMDLVQQLAPQVTLRVEPFSLDQLVACEATATPADATPAISPNLIAVGGALRGTLLAREGRA